MVPPRRIVTKRGSRSFGRITPSTFLFASAQGLTRCPRSFILAYLNEADKYLAYEFHQSIDHLASHTRVSHRPAGIKCRRSRRSSERLPRVWERPPSCLWRGLNACSTSATA